MDLETVKNQIIESLLSRMKKFLLGEEEKEETPEEKTPRERLIDMYASEREDKNTEGNVLSKPKEENNVKYKYVIIKPKTDDNMVLQEIEKIQKDKEEIEKQKGEIGKDREHLYSQQAQLKSAFEEAKRKQII
jgi:hypothetical protein